MTNEQYQLTFFINATHTVTLSGKRSSHHPHTFEIVCFVKASQLIEFEKLENNINQVLNQLNNQDLNQLQPFKAQVPTLENITRFLYKVITINLRSLGCQLNKIRVAESPTRAFIVE